MTTISESAVYPMVPGNNLQAYLDSVNQIPVLSREREQELFSQFQGDNDLEAARTIVMAHLRYVVYVAKGYVGYGLPLEDLIQQGNVGLMRSVKKFDSDREVRLITFAIHWIKAEIHDYVLKNWKLVKVATTKAQRKLFFNLRKSKEKLGWMNRQESQELASQLSVSAEDVVEMEARLGLSDRSFHAESEDDYGAPETFLSVDEAEDPAFQAEQCELDSAQTVSMRSALAALDDRSRDIVESRWLQQEKVGLKELAARYSISMERVRQLEAAAFKKMQPFLR
jgi:RNA polymerase sigma-32 factor